MKHFILFYYHLFINTESQDIKHVCGHIARRLNEVEVDKRRWGGYDNQISIRVQT